MAAIQNVPQHLQDRNFTPITPKRGVITLSGYGIRVQVDRGHLILEDGIGPVRRHGRFARVNHGVRRLVVIGADGFVSLAALRWLADQHSAFVMLERDGSVLVSTGPASSSDARLRRAQALATQSGAGSRIIKALISAKLAGQERIARDSLNNPEAAEKIANARTSLALAATISAIRGLEARAALAYWHAWRDTQVSFPSVDLRRVPEHWRTFGTRISPISGSPRCAVNPLNAILNFLYALVESESRLALAAVGLDPGLGFMHVDSRTRDSLACDLMEPVRPEVDSYVLGWIRYGLFRRKDFFEMNDGTCRLMAGFCAQLSQTARTWGNAIAPWAELIANTIWATVEKPGRLLATPLTGDHRRDARGGQHTRPAMVPPKPSRICKVCGVTCEKTYCAACGRAHSRAEFDKGRRVAQSPESRARRSATQRAHVTANRNWKSSEDSEWLDRRTFSREIQPLLREVKISTLRSALGISEPYARGIRSGSRIPHPRHWLPLARLVRDSTGSLPGGGDRIDALLHFKK
jgi:CRISPR-associated endonuclease Cas1